MLELIERRSKVQEKNMSCERALNFDQLNVLTKTRNELEPPGKSWNELESSRTSWNQLESAGTSQN